MATRNLRIEPVQLPSTLAAAAAAARNNNRDGAAAAPFRRLTPAALASQALRLLLQALWIATSLGVVMACYSVLSSPTVSYLLALTLAAGSALTSAAMRPDKLAPVFAIISGLLALLIFGYHLGLFPIRVFLLLSGLVGIVCALSLAVLSVFSGTHASQRGQIVCFVVALLGVGLGSTAQLIVLGPNSSAYLYGLELSVVASIVNLVMNKQTGSSTGSHGGGNAAGGRVFTAVDSGGFIAGRDSIPYGHDRFENGAPQSTPVATPQCVSPALQYASRRS